MTDELPGLAVTSWIENGTDILALIGTFRGATAESGKQPSIRLYPTELRTTNNSVVTQTGWRAVYEALPKTPNPGVFSTNCFSWAVVDAPIYGGIGADEWLFNMSENGEAVSVEPRMLQNELQKSGNGGVIVIGAERLAKRSVAFVA